MQSSRPDQLQSVREEILQMFRDGADEVAKRLEARRQEIEADASRHGAFFQALGTRPREVAALELAENHVRLLAARAGIVAQEAITRCFRVADPACGPACIRSHLAGGPAHFLADAVYRSRFAHEYKWRDATTDGDHRRKERLRMEAFREAGLVPVRIMLYTPQRRAALAAQRALRKSYERAGGLYLAEDESFDYILSETGVDLPSIIEEAGASFGE